LAPVTLEADVRAAARAEALFGAGKPFRIFLYLTIGTGISSCLMIDGEPYTGARGATGTMASSPLGVMCEACDHLTMRTLEDFASGPALVKRHNARRPGTASKGQDVFAAAQSGDTDALAILQSAGAALGVAAGQLVNVLDPEAIIVGGGLGLSEGPYWEAFVVTTRRHIWSEVNRDLPILHAASGSLVGVIGAAAAAWIAASARKD
jgi:glucokinase